MQLLLRMGELFVQKDDFLRPLGERRVSMENDEAVLLLGPPS